jgi:hypothetical protein
MRGNENIAVAIAASPHSQIPLAPPHRHWGRARRGQLGEIDGPEPTCMRARKLYLLHTYYAAVLQYSTVRLKYCTVCTYRAMDRRESDQYWNEAMGSRPHRREDDPIRKVTHAWYLSIRWYSTAPYEIDRHTVRGRLPTSLCSQVALPTMGVQHQVQGHYTIPVPRLRRSQSTRSILHIYSNGVRVHGVNNSYLMENKIKRAVSLGIISRSCPSPHPAVPYDRYGWICTCLPFLGA